MGLRFDLETGGTRVFDVQHHGASAVTISAGAGLALALNGDHNGVASVSGGGGVQASAGSAARSGTASISGGGTITVTGAVLGRRFDSPDATGGVIFDLDTALSAGLGVVVISGGGQVQANGAANLVGGAATITAGLGGPTVAIEKNAIGAWLINLHGDLAVTGTPGKNAQVQATVTGGGQVSAAGSGPNRAIVTGGSTLSGAVEKAGAQQLQVAGGGQVFAVGVKAEFPATVTISGGGTVTASGTQGKAATGGSVVRGNGIVSAAVLKLAAAIASISVGLGLITTATKDVDGTATISAGGSITAQSSTAGSEIVGEIDLKATFIEEVNLKALVRK